MHFVDRIEAGNLLAERIKRLDIDYDNTLVLGIPRGGAIVANQVSKIMNLPLELFFFQRFGSILNPELTVGAIDENNNIVYNMNLAKYLGLTIKDLNSTCQNALSVLHNYSTAMRRGHSIVTLDSKEVILVDDGMVTGATMEMIIHLLRKNNIRRIILAVPVSSPEALIRVKGLVDEVVAIITPPHLTTVAEWYLSFLQLDNSDISNVINS